MRERAIVNQTNIGTVSKAPSGKHPRDGVKRIRVLQAHRYHLQLNKKLNGCYTGQELVMRVYGSSGNSDCDVAGVRRRRKEHNVFVLVYLPASTKETDTMAVMSLSLLLCE